MDKFWMVFGGYESKPTLRHDSEQDAQVEARRLCEKHGKEFFILEATTVVRPSKPPIEVVKLG